MRVVTFLFHLQVTVFSHRRYSEAYTNSESFGLDLIQLARQAGTSFITMPFVAAP